MEDGSQTIIAMSITNELYEFENQEVLTSLYYTVDNTTHFILDISILLVVRSENTAPYLTEELAKIPTIPCLRS